MLHLTILEAFLSLPTIIAFCWTIDRIFGEPDFVEYHDGIFWVIA